MLRNRKQKSETAATAEATATAEITIMTEMIAEAKLNTTTTAEMITEAKLSTVRTAKITAKTELSATATAETETTIMKVITKEKTLTAEIREKKCECKLKKSSVSKTLMMSRSCSSIRLMHCFKTEI